MFDVSKVNGASLTPKEGEEDEIDADITKLLR